MWKRHDQWIALLVILAFIGLLQAAAAPLRAEPAADRAGASVSSPEPGPGCIEQEGYGSAAARKKSILPIVIGVVAVGAIAAVLALVVLKTKYDITGSWEIHFTSSAPAHTWAWTLVFSGDKKSGTFNDSGDTGTYTVDDKNVTLQYDEWDIQLLGQFDGKDKMTGNATFSGLTIGGLDINSATWTATRLGSGSSVKPGTTAVRSSDGRKAAK